MTLALPLMSRAARNARSGSFRGAMGAPKSTMIASPRNLSMVPSYRLDHWHQPLKARIDQAARFFGIEMLG